MNSSFLNREVSFLPYMIHSIIAVLCCVSYSFAQVAGLPAPLQEKDQAAIEAIAMYPADKREAVLVVAQHPEILIRMEYIRRHTEENFKNMLTGIPEKDQKKIYNISRYPEFIKAVVEKGEKLTAAEMENLLQDYPKEIHEDAKFSNHTYFKMLRDMDSFYRDAEEEFHEMLSSYPPEVRDAATRLAGLPAIVSLLNKNINSTIILGDLYQRNPMRLNKTLDSLHIIASENQAAELNEWKKQLEENPNALTEMESEIGEFAGKDESDDDDVYVRSGRDDHPDADYRERVWRPYVYWFGWPSWYSYECWYPYPAWYHCGYYYDGPGHIIVIVSLPSDFFMDWHFRHHHHLYHYPHFTNVMFRHYYGPRKFGRHAQPVLQRWEREHSGTLPSNWWNDDKERVNRIREFGKFSMDYEEVKNTQRDRSPSEREYLREHADRYPTLKPVLTEPVRPGEKERPSYKPTEERKVISPERAEPKRDIPREKRTEPSKEKSERQWDRNRQESRDKETPPKAVPERKEQSKPARSAPTKQTEPKKEPRRSNDGRSSD